MLDFPNKLDPTNIRESANDDAHSREGDLASDALGVPLLINEPAPLSDALHIPTLIDEKPDKTKTETRRPDARSVPAEPRPLSGYLRKEEEREENVPQPLNAARENPQFDRFGRKRTGPDEVEPQNSNRATTPADKPKSDAWSLIGVPSNHPQTEAGGKLAKLDKVALAFGAVIVIGPLFAAMIGRMAL